MRANPLITEANLIESKIRVSIEPSFLTESSCELTQLSYPLTASSTYLLFDVPLMKLFQIL